VTTLHNQELRLEQSYGVCPTCGAGFFPPSMKNWSFCQDN
jgi:uncharacterized OB-fold protein